MTDFWQNCWENKRTPWDLGGSHPLLPRLWELMEQYSPHKKFLRALVPGAGKGHDGHWLSQVIPYVVVSDLIPEAVSTAKKLYGQNPGLDFLVHNALLPYPENLEASDVIYDRAMLCALPAKLRKEYVQACYNQLTNKGVFMGIVFAAVTNEEGPPFAVSSSELLALFPEPIWQPLFMQECHDGATNEVITVENLIAFIKV